MTFSHFIVGTAGHIDHGKSALVEALSGIHPDRLPEEKARGMTIDLGFAHVALPHPEKPEVTLSVGLIDVPGHADFVKNMVAGVGSIDVALFIVAADDGWMPQTEEHLQILTYLGVKHAVVAMTKADLVEDPEYAKEVLRESLLGTVFENAPIVATSAPLGLGIAELKAALAEVLAATPPAADIGKPRLPVDRTFSPTGIGTVITGTLTGGILEKGQEVVLQPRGQKTHLRSVQSHSKSAAAAQPRTRTAVNLADTAIAQRGETGGVARGDVVTLAGLGEACDTLDVLLEKSDREVPANALATRDVRNGQKLYWHHGGSNLEARVYFLGSKSLQPGQKVLAQIRFKSPAYAFHGDRFVLRDFSKQATVAGGIVLDPDASRAAFRKPPQRQYLERRAESIGDIGQSILAQLERDHALLRPGLFVKSRFSQPAVEAAISGLLSAKQALADGSWLLDGTWWQQQVEAAKTVIATYHKAQPQLQGMDLGEFSAAVSPALPSVKLLDLLISHLTAQGYVRSGKVIRSGQHRMSLPPQLQQAGTRLRTALGQNPIEPPSLAELMTTPLDRQALKFLLDNREAISLDEKTVILATAYDGMTQLIISYLKEKRQASMSDIRLVVGTTRRILVPMMERLDKEGVTKRNGDVRVLKNP